ncbi:MAG: hypothetical protein V7721_03565 [Porticoccaceae bacterium]
MKNSTKAVLLSAFILPGAGHFFLKKYVSAAVLLSLIVFPLYVLITSALERALLITNKILSGETQADMSIILDLISKQTVGSNAGAIEFSTMALIVVWLIGIADSYRLGKSL